MLNPYQLAKEIRETTWKSDILPIDPVTIAEKMGINVYNLKLPNTVSGSILKEPGQDASIYVNDSDSENRKRFTIACEIGHYVFNSENGDEEFSYVDYRMSTSGDLEVFSTKFAEELLMPYRQLNKIYTRTRSVSMLALEFGVSTEVMLNRLKHVNLVKDPEAA